MTAHNAIKRYALFAGHHYYPDGGWGDFCGLFDSMDEAKAFTDSGGAAREYSQPDWAQIVDLVSANLVLCGEYDRRGNRQWEWEVSQ